MNEKIAALIGALVFIVITVAVAPTMFTGLNTTGGPTWLNTVLPIVVASGLIFAVWSAFN